MDTMENPPVVCWWMDRVSHTGGGYWHLQLHVFEAVPKQISVLLAAVPSEYSNPERVVDLEAFYRRLLDRDKDVVFDPGFSSSRLPSFMLEWLEYESRDDPKNNGYCRHKVNLGDGTFEEAKLGLDLLDKVYRVSSKFSESSSRLDDPQIVVLALEKMGAVPVERADRAMFEPLTYVRRTERRMRLRTEGVLSLFGE